MSLPAVPAFADRLIAWQRAHGRHDLPWQADRDPYRIWLAEVMLQQTQVASAIPYYLRFLERFPDLAALARASADEVMSAWAGLGYYSRARNLHRCAQSVLKDHGGSFPKSAQALAQLPGIGRSTAAAIAAFAFGERAAILDGNVRRVLARHDGIAGATGSSALERRLWQAAEAHLPQAAIEPYTQGLMDLGASLCTRRNPQCGRCPVAQSCVAHAEGRTAELPGARAARPRPLKQATLVLVRDPDGAVLLQRRPPAGIWGGLVSLPEFDPLLDDAALAHAAERALGLQLCLGETLPPIQHEFSHYSFLMRPRLARLIGTPAAGESGQLWVHPSALDAAALPAPIRRLLLALDAEVAPAT